MMPGKVEEGATPGVLLGGRDSRDDKDGNDGGNLSSAAPAVPAVLFVPAASPLLLRNLPRSRHVSSVKRSEERESSRDLVFREAGRGQRAGASGTIPSTD